MDDSQVQDQNQTARDLTSPSVSNQHGGADLLQPQIQLEGGLVEEIATWLQNELYQAENRRSAMEDRLNQLTRTYEAKPEEERKSFPWDGACNLVVPVAATAVETVQTRLIGSIFGSNDLYAGRARSANWADSVDPIVTFLNWVNENVFDAYRVYGRWILSCIKYGNSVLKLPWVRKIREVRYMDSHGGLVQEQVVMHDGPKPEFIPLEDFYWSSDANATQDLQDCEWVAHRFYSTWKQLKENELSGIYFDVDKIKENKRSQFKDSETDMHERTGEQPEEPADYELYEVWASYPIDDSGQLAEIVVTIHRDTRTIIRAVYNFYRHQERPFHMIRFFPRETSLLAIGLVEMLSDVQEEVTAIHRNRIDNATLANAKIYKRTNGANVQFDEVFPGAVIDVETETDLTSMDMGKEHSSLLLEEQHSLTIGEKRSGVSDYSVGRESSAIGSRATATSTTALIREGNKRFQFLIKEIRKALTDVGHQIISLYQQFAPDRQVLYELFSDKDKQLFQEIMTLPPEYSRANIVIDVKSLDDNNNKEIQQQAYMMMLQVIQETYLNVGNALMIVGNPEAPPAVQGLAQQGAKAASKLIERLLESFDFKDAEYFSPNVDELLAMAGVVDQMGLGGMHGGGQTGNIGPTQGPAGTGAPSRLPDTAPGTVSETAGSAAEIDGGGTEGAGGLPPGLG